ncbi:MAG: hypothetical protein AB9891_18240 [Anaerolineaceae bacterium]
MLEFVKHKKILLGSIILLILCGFVFTPNIAGQTDQERLAKLQNSQEIVWQINRFAPIPLTDFSTENNQITLEFKADTLEARLIKNGSIWLNLPERELPIMVIEVDENHFLVITRKLFSGELSFVQIADGKFIIHPIPEEYSDFIFQEADVLGNEIVVVLFNPYSNTNILLVWEIKSEHSIEIQKKYFRELFPGKTGLDSIFHLVKGYDPSHAVQGLYIIYRSTFYIYTNTEKPDMQYYELDEDLDIIDIVSDGKNVAGLFQANPLYELAIENDTVSYFKFINLTTRLLLKEGQIKDIPKLLGKYSEIGDISFVETSDELISNFIARIKSQPQSGLMNLGMNNFEGLVVESQIDYLSGLNDLLFSWPGLDSHSDVFTQFQNQIKLRLDLEIYLLDRLLDRGQPGLEYKGESVKRTPVITGPHAASVLSLFNIYLRDNPSHIIISNYEKLENDVISLENTVNEFVWSDSAIIEGSNVNAFIRYKKGSPVFFDGANLPYSDQHLWVKSITSLPPEKIDGDLLDLSRQMVVTFLRNEAGGESLPEDYQWQKNYGYAANGWSKDMNISINRPVFAGDQSYASIKSSTTDLDAILSLGKLDQAILPPEINTYITKGVKEGRLLPGLNRNIFRLYDEIPKITHPRLLKNYYFSPSNWEVQKRSWGLLYLLQNYAEPTNSSAVDLPPILFDQQTGSINTEKSTPPDQNQLLFVSAGLLLFTSLVLISQFKIRAIPAFVIGIYLVTFAQIVIIFEIGSLVNAANSKQLFLGINAGFFVLSVILWFLFHRPHLIYPLRDKKRLPYLISESIGSIKQYAFVWILGLGVLAAFAYTAYLIMIIPQNYDDILTTHLARVGFWLQSGSFLPWKVSIYNLPQVISPANAQILILWTVLFYGGDQLAALTQWSAGFVVIFGIFGICRLLKYSVPKAAFCGLLFITLPMVALQLSTALNDLISTALFISSLYLLYKGWNENDRGALILSSLALALSLGTKQTILFTGPGLIISLLLLFFYLPDDRLKKLYTWALSGVILFILVGSYFYIQNFFVFGQFLGPNEVADAYTRTIGITLLDRVGMAFENLFKYAVISLLTGFQELLSLSGVTDFNFSDIFGQTSNLKLGTRLSVGVGTGGPLLFTLIIFGVFAGIKKWKSDIDPIKLSLLAIGLTYIIILFVIRKFSNALFRYSMISYATLFPMVGLITFGYFKNNTKTIRGQLMMGFVAVFAIFTMAFALIVDGGKSVITNGLRPEMDRTFKQTLIMSNFYHTLKNIEDFVPQNASLGLIIPDKFPISPLFGKYFTRQIVQFVPEEDGSVNWSQYQPVEFLLVDTKLFSRGFAIPFGYMRLIEKDGYMLLQKQVESN